MANNLEIRNKTKVLIEDLAKHILHNNATKDQCFLQDKMIIKLAYVLHRISDEYDIRTDDGPMTSQALIQHFSNDFEESLTFNEL